MVSAVVFIIALFLPWFSWGTYISHFEFSLSDALNSDATSAVTVTERINIPVYGTDMLVFRIDSDVIIIYLISLITAVICLLLCLPFLTTRWNRIRSQLGLAQICFSIIGLLPFIFIPSFLNLLRQATRNNYPDQLPRSSAMSFGIILAIFATVGLVFGAVLTHTQIRKNKDVVSLPALSFEEATTQVEQPQAKPAGWYFDPDGLDQLRYWDGAVWTDHLAGPDQKAYEPPE